MGKPPGKPDGKMKLMGVIAIVAAVLLLIVIALALWTTLHPKAPLPAAPATNLPDLPAPALPEARQKPIEAAPLPETKVPAAPQAPVTEVQPQPKEEAPQPSGTVTWRWLLYPVSPSILGQQIQGSMSGFQFVALGVTIYNRSTENVAVDNNAFSLNVDGKIYRSDQFSTADAVISGFPFLSPTTLAPGGTVSGQTAFMIPRVFSRVVADWQINVPKTVKVVRVDPAAPFAPAARPAAPAAPTNRSNEE
ncbi:MAG: DUF4352 domain-containing protein [Armatimonadia bacterium]